MGISVEYKPKRNILQITIKRLKNARFYLISAVYILEDIIIWVEFVRFKTLHLINKDFKKIEKPSRIPIYINRTKR